MKLARLLKKKAFTLVELIIAMAIMMILIVAAMSMFNPVSSIIKSIDEDVVTNAIADSMTTLTFTIIHRLLPMRLLTKVRRKDASRCSAR